ncbi:hypothetical protein BYT27DRAFT_7191172 [Phlegmacium glaucopus]|nr:hypothetical protein BYT27DRAFT_7191172 [Phlegmacium glaucopus]
MPASRTHDRSQYAEGSSSKTTPGSKHRKSRNNLHSEPTSTPGVQKVKALLRQTRRLLAKDNLAANVRVETERRQKALEAELGQAEQGKKERALSVRYHKVKFFERQKVTRKLKQTKKCLEKADSSHEKETIAANIHELRVDLNYVLHYPRTKKYISLFPPEVRKGAEVDTSVSSSTESQKTIEEREKVREWIREQMEKGGLPTEPDLNLDSHPRTVKSRTWKKDDAPTIETPTYIEEDAFFGDSDG